MLNHAKLIKYFTIAQAAKLVGLPIRELKELNRTRTGPRFYGTGEYIVYPENHIREWVIKNVHAPALWFNRFDNPDPRTVQRMYIYNSGKYYRLNPSHEAKLILEMARRANPNEGGMLRLCRPDSPALLSARNPDHLPRE